MTCKTVAVILVNWNQKEDLIECLGSINNIKYPDLGVFLIDNNSSDGSVEKAKKIYKKKIRIIKNRTNVGFAKANNIGINYALQEKYDYVMLLNSDTVIEENAVSNMVSFLEKRAQIAAVSPLILLYHKKDIIWYAGGIFTRNFRRFRHRGSYQDDKRQFDKPQEIDFLTGCCFMVKSELLRETGLLDEKFFMYCEDSDLSLRLKRKNKEIYFFPGSKVWHKVADRAMVDRRFYYHYYMDRNRLFLIKKHKPGILFQEVPYTIMKAIFNLLRFKITRGLAGVKATVDFMIDRGGRV